MSYKEEKVNELQRREKIGLKLHHRNIKFYKTMENVAGFWGGGENIT